MKKRIFALIFVLIMLLPAFCATAEPMYDGKYYRFNDYANLLTEEEAKGLNDKINESIEPLKMDFPIFVLEKYEEDMDFAEYAGIVYQNNSFGYGAEKSGIFLILDVGGSNYNIFFYGNAESKIPKNRRDALFETTSALFDNMELSNNDVFSGYLDAAFALTKEWNVDKADKENGMPYWYADDIAAFRNYHAENPPRVVDNAGLFTAEEFEELNAQVERICDENGFSYVIFTDNSTHGLSKEVYSADFLYYGGYGIGDDYSAVCFFLSLEPGNRGWRTTSIGSYQDIFTSDVTYMIDEIVDSDMRAGNYYKAIKNQADYIEENLTKGKARGKEVGEIKFRVKSKFRGFLGWPLIVGIIISLIIAGMIVDDMKKKMRVETAVSANEYLKKGSLKIRNKSVKLLYTSITRREKSEKSSGGGSHYSSGSASSGGSYSSGGRDF